MSLFSSPPDSLSSNSHNLQRLSRSRLHHPRCPKGTTPPPSTVTCQVKPRSSTTWTLGTPSYLSPSTCCTSPRAKFAGIGWTMPSPASLKSEVHAGVQAPPWSACSPGFTSLLPFLHFQPLLQSPSGSICLRLCPGTLGSPPPPLESHTPHSPHSATSQRSSGHPAQVHLCFPPLILLFSSFFYSIVTSHNIFPLLI